MLRNTIVGCLLLGAALGACTEGCLKCSPQNDCLYCDFVNGYVLKDRSCVLSKIPNCVNMNERGTCSQCDVGYYVDYYTGYCSQIPANNVIDKCLNYQSLTACAVCEVGYYVKNGKCVAVTTAVDRCQVQVSADRCGQCQPDYYLALDGKTCTKSPNLNNCISYSPVQCGRCAKGFLRNTNYYISYIFGQNNSLSARRTTSRIYSQTNQLVDEAEPVCERTDIPNCEEYETASRCARCAAGFYLDAALQCAPNPLQGISKCQQYASDGACLRCAPNYFVAGPAECLPVITLDYCQLYDSTALTPTCLQCQYGYYLFGDNNCVKRSIVSDINFCARLSPFLERCDQCYRGYRPTDDGLLCLEEVPNCATYQPSSKSTYRHVCSVCRDGYFFKTAENFCQLGAVDNCQVYVPTANTCAVCQNGYYLVNGVCANHSPAKLCLTYSPNQRNYCSVCENQTMLFWVSNACVEMRGIENCVAYNLKGECTLCRDGFFIENAVAESCVPIPPEEHCLQMNLAGCTRCEPGFTLTAGKCFLPVQYKIKNCQQHNVDGVTGQDAFVCRACNEFSVPLEYKNHLQCVERNVFLERVAAAPSVDAFCTAFSVNPQTRAATCIACAKNKVLDHAGVCVDACVKDLSSTLYQQTFSYFNLNMWELQDAVAVEQTRVCGPTIPNCAVATPALRQNFIEQTYTCARCDPLAIKVLPPPKYLNALFVGEPGENPASVPAFTCEVPPANTVIGMENPGSNLIDGCDLYSRIIHGITGCTKCVTGKNAIVFNLVKNCLLYNEFTFQCTKCQPGFYLRAMGITHECMEITDIPYCVRYDSAATSTVCVQCDSDHFVANAGAACTLRVDSFRVASCTPNVGADTCNCADSMIWNTVTKQCDALPRYCTTAAYTNAVLGCTVCDNTKAYLSSGVCLLGTVNNCATYAAGANTCTACANGFQLDNANNNNRCVAHDTSKNPQCVTWDQSALNTCSRCPATSFLFTVDKVCVPTVSVPRCKSFSSAFVCEECEDGYYLVNHKQQCLPIPDSFNCDRLVPIKSGQANGVPNGLVTDAEVGTSNDEFFYTCKLCKPFFGQVVRTYSSADANNNNYNVKACSISLHYLRDSCTEGNAPSENTPLLISDASLACLGCPEGKYPFSMLNQNVCLHTDFIKDYHAGVQNFDQTVPNCKKFNGATCEECAFPFGFLSGPPPVCQTCDYTQNALKIGKYTQSTATEFTISYQKTCDTPTVANCMYEAPLFPEPGNAGNDHAYTCVKCRTGYLPLIAFDATYTMLPTDPVSDAVPSVNAAFTPISACQASTSVVLGTTDATGFVYNCKYYQLLANGYYGCVRCNFGYTGEIRLRAGAPAAEYGYIDACVPFAECAANVVYEGLSNTVSNVAKIDSLFSCHKCTAADEVPVAFVDAGTANTMYVNVVGLQPYIPNPTVGSPFIDVGASTYRGRHNECLTVTELTTAKSNADTSFYGFGQEATPANKPPTNCALLIANVRSTGDISGATGNGQSATTVGLWCAACKPGYAPTYATTNGFTHFITACTAITNCDLTAPGTLLNGCNTGVHLFDLSNDSISTTAVVDKAKITSTLNKNNCFAADVRGYCAVCKKGFSLNAKGICEAVAVPRCAETDLSDAFYNRFDPSYANRNFYFYLYAYAQKGCTKCDAGFALYKLTGSNAFEKNICLTFNETPAPVPAAATFDFNAQTGALDYSGSAAPANCLLFYGLAANKKCKKCATDYALTEVGTCVQNSLVFVTDCKYVSSTADLMGLYSSCYECKSGFLNIGGLCYDSAVAANQRLVANCATYNTGTSATNPSGRCSACNSGFYLESNLCKPITVPNCAEYDTGTSACTKCNPNYGLVTYNTNKKVCYPLISATNNMDFDANCLEVDSAQLASGTLRCSKCKAGFVLNTLGTTYGFCQAFDKSELLRPGCKTYTTAVNLAGSTFACDVCDLTRNYKVPNLGWCLPRRTSDARCTAYHDNYDICTACDADSVLAMNKLQCLQFTRFNVGYLGTCRNMPECKLTEMDGLPLEVAALLSCHECKDADKIPFLFAASGPMLERPLRLRRFSLNPKQPTVPYADGDNDTSVRCLAPTAATFNLTSAFNFPQNCAVGVVNLDLPASAVDSSKAAAPAPGAASIFCTACKPKFAATPALDADGRPVKNFVAGCTAIANCDYSNVFNACTLCSRGFAFLFSKQRGIQYDTCVDSASNPNCLAVTTVGARKVCRYCKKGFYRNVDGICEQLDPPKCESGAFSFKTFFERPSLATAISLGLWGPGCRQCQPGFVGVVSPLGELVCTESFQHSSAALIDTTRFVKNCRNYEVDPAGGFYCAVCADGFTLTVDRKCVAAAAMPNCTLFAGQRCARCDNSTAISDRVCNAQSVKNCEVYVNDPSLWEPTCHRCQPGFFLDGNVCAPSPVLNCRAHANAKLCNECQPGFAPVLVRNQTHYCMPVDPALNCAAFVPGDFQSRVLRCERCAKPNFVLSLSKTDYYNTHCLQFVEVPNCRAYHTFISLAATTFACVSCNDGYYMLNNACVPRAVQFLNCLSYNPATDSCSACTDGFYLTPDGRNCVSFPTGIAGCVSYVSRTVCAACSKNYFLAFGSCEPIADADLVKNCLVHANARHCALCDRGFFAVAGECRAVYAENCASYSSPFSCQTCAAGFGLQKKGDLINCVQKTDANCLTSDSVFPFNCLACSKGFYPKDGVCAQVPTPVANCEVYATATTCAECAAGYALSVDGTSCDTNAAIQKYLDNNCAASFVLAAPTCTVCRPGFYFVGDACSECPQNQLNTGCYSCDPSNPAVCLMCAPGYYMDLKGVCNLNLK